MSFYDAIDYLVRNSQDYDWDYYHCHNSCGTVEDVFKYPDSFVADTFVCAKKRLLITGNHKGQYSFDRPNISDARAAHSISSFYTGYLLAQGLLGDRMDAFCQVFGTENGIFSFSYVWNLTCLYHDFGYDFENNGHKCEIVKNEISRASERFSEKQRYREPFLFNGYSLSAVSKEFSIRRTYLPVGLYSGLHRDDSAENRFINSYVRNNKNLLLCIGAPVKCPHRSARIVERYLNYRLFGHGLGCLDHGIMGGLTFYNLIIENYIKAYRGNRDVCSHRNFTDFEITNMMGAPLRVVIEQTILFAYISDCIINHNIWKAPEGREDIYRGFGLEALVGHKFEKINFYKNPLLFILVMADCLEPYKNYCKVSCGHGIDDLQYNKDEAMTIFKNYNLTVEDSTVAITVPDSWIDACEGKLKDMQDWIAIDCAKQSNKFTITPIMT